MSTAAMLYHVLGRRYPGIKGIEPPQDCDPRGDHGTEGLARDSVLDHCGPVHPDVVITDLQMPVKDGLTAIREIDEEGLGAQILVLTSFPDDDMVFAATKLNIES